MSNPYDDIIHDWWRDVESDTFYTLIERPDGQLRLIISPKYKEEPKQ